VSSRNLPRLRNEPKFDEIDSNTPVPELDSTPKKGRASTTKKVVNAKKEVIERPRAKRRKRRWHLPILMETIIIKEVCERKAKLELEILNQWGVLRIDSKYTFRIFFYLGNYFGRTNFSKDIKWL
jgi:hypothetical protein